MSQKRNAIYFKDDSTGKEPAKDWLLNLKDKLGKAKIMARISRAELGNFGDHKSVGSGLYELRIDFGPGYRVYYSLDGLEIIILFYGGDKSTQNKDIKKAQEYLDVYKLKK